MKGSDALAISRSVPAVYGGDDWADSSNDGSALYTKAARSRGRPSQVGLPYC